MGQSALHRLGIPPGDSGGGFDKLRFLFPKSRKDFKLSHDDISLEVEVNRRGDGRPQVNSACPGTAAACPSAR